MSAHEFLPGQKVRVTDIRTAEVWDATVTAVYAGEKVLEVSRDSTGLVYKVGVGFVHHAEKGA